MFTYLYMNRNAILGSLFETLMFIKTATNSTPILLQWRMRMSTTKYLIATHKNATPT